MSQPELSILIPAMPQRRYMELVDALSKQAEAENGSVEVLYKCDDGLSGPKRQRLVERSTGRYIAFVDDDDRVADNYVTALLSAAQSGADVLTFNLDFYRNGCKRETWQFGKWVNNRAAGMMCLNHLCAWRRDIATRVAWCPNLGHNDDHLWFEPLFHAGLVSTTAHIEQSLYHYLYQDNQTVNQSPRMRRQSAGYMNGGKRCWLVDGEIFIEHEDGMARDRHNQATPMPSCQPYHMVYPKTTKRELGIKSCECL